MAESNQELASVLFARKEKSEATMSKTNSARKRKLARMQALRDQDGNQAPQLLGVGVATGARGRCPVTGDWGRCPIMG